MFKFVFFFCVSFSYRYVLLEQGTYSRKRYFLYFLELSAQI